MNTKLPNYFSPNNLEFHIRNVATNLRFPRKFHTVTDVTLQTELTVDNINRFQSNMQLNYPHL